VSKMETKRGGGPGRQGKRRQFTEELKAGGVRLVLDEGTIVAQAARNLDLTLSAVSGWVKQAPAGYARTPWDFTLIVVEAAGVELSKAAHHCERLPAHSMVRIPASPAQSRSFPRVVAASLPQMVMPQGLRREQLSASNLVQRDQAGEHPSKVIDVRRRAQAIAKRRRVR
jgi:transposase-like protein